MTHETSLQWLMAILLLAGISGCQPAAKKQEAARPNILVIMSDNQYFSHIGCYGDKTVRTPNTDKVAAEGVRFTNAFCNSPSCTPSRAAFLTGQDIWRLKEGADLWSILPTQYPIVPDLLDASGYQVGFQGKGWGPGSFTANGRKRNPGGNPYDNFAQFLQHKKPGGPWSYWLCRAEPSRPFEEVGIGAKSGIDPAKVTVPGYLPDAPDVRTDIADYYYSVEVFDSVVGDALNQLKKNRELDNTIVVVCSDNGWQMPRGLANLYDFGTHVPLIISWPAKFKKGAVASGLVTLNDLAPTFLEAAGLPVPADMTAKSLLPVLEANPTAKAEDREFVVLGRERHAFVRRHGLGYPGRAIRTKQYLYIRNYDPNRWPAGDPPLYGDIDPYMLNFPGPTKLYMMANKDNPTVKPLFELGMGKRPAEELFDITKDTDELHNLAYDPAFKAVKDQLAAEMQDYLVKTKDPRATGGDVSIWDKAPYFSDIDKRAHPSPEAIKEFKLDSVYDYVK